jgi:hypothetical protein
LFYFHVHIQSTSTTLSLLPPLHLPSSSHWYLPPERACLSSYPSVFKVYIDCSWVFCLGTSYMYVLYFNQINPLHYLVYHHVPRYSIAHNAFYYTIFIHTCNVFHYYSCVTISCF